jgi:hypothetical protein
MASVDAVFNSHRDTIIALARRYSIPTMYGWPEFPREGEGGKPQDLPVIQPTKFNFLKTMKKLNVEIPANILALADEAIE